MVTFDVNIDAVVFLIRSFSHARVVLPFFEKFMAILFQNDRWPRVNDCLRKKNRLWMEQDVHLFFVDEKMSIKNLEPIVRA